jgi:hypothetical protein
MRLLVSLSSHFVPPRIFEPVEPVKVSVNGARTSWEGTTMPRGKWQIQSELFYDYRTNVDAYPAWQA